MEKHLLVFGGSGFIGQAICQEAVKQGLKVISFSPSGKPVTAAAELTSPLITWLKTDIFKDNNWQSYFLNAFAVINLIGILRENPAKQLTYQRMIVEANQLIADQVMAYPELTYLFLSANSAGPVIPEDYIISKRQAEVTLSNLPNPVVIFRPGLVVSPKRPFSLINGLGIYCLSHLPLLKKSMLAVYPIKLERLAKRVILESTSTVTKRLTLKEI